jgi:NNMT/PNMT/TEMT family protein
MTRPTELLIGNADCPWDDFNPNEYSAHNYGILREEDEELLKLIRDYFTEAVTGQRLRHGIDLGAGPNLYPSLAMLPFCDEITLAERGAANRRWLKEQIKESAGYDKSWDRFWDVLEAARPYGRVNDPRSALRERARVKYCDVFRFRQQRSWGIGTMFFVAESITAQLSEFQKAARQFVRTLRIGAPFAAAFMRNSRGYTVGTHRFPAVAVDEGKIEQTLTSVAEIDEIIRIRFNADAPLRDGYEGMILALGRAC